MIFDMNALSAFNADTGFDFNSGVTNYGNYADFGSMTDGLNANLFSDQLSAFQPTWGQKALGGLNDLGQGLSQNMGLATLGIGAINGLSSLYSGNKQMGMYKDQMNEQRRQWNLNYNNQVQALNEQRSDRQRQRVAANPNAESVESYMAKWGTK